MLAKAKSPLGERGKEGQTPVALVAINQHEEAIKELLSSGADAKGSTGIDGTPTAATVLHVAAFGGSAACARLLLDAGADPAATDGQVAALLPLPPPPSSPR